MNFFVFTSRSKTMPLASFLVAHSHGCNFVVKCEGNSLVWNQYIMKPKEKIVGEHDILYPQCLQKWGPRPSCPPPNCACSQLLQCSPNDQNLTPSSAHLPHSTTPCFACALQLTTFSLHCSLMPRQASRSHRWNSKTLP